MSGQHSPSNDALLQQLARKENLFGQLNSFFTQVQSETPSLETFKSKLADLERMRNERKELNAQLNAAGERIHDLSSANDDMKMRNESLQGDLVQLNERLLNQTAKSDRLQGELDSKAEQFMALETTLQDTIKALKTEYAETKQELEHANESLAVARETNQELNTQVMNLAGLRSDWAVEKKGLDQMVDALRIQVSDLEKKKVELNTHFRSVSDELKGSQSKIENLEEEKEKAEFELTARKKELSQRMHASKDIEGKMTLELAQLREDLDRLNQGYSAMRDEKEVTETKLKAQLNEKEVQLKQLQEQVEIFSQQSGSKIQQLSTENQQLHGEKECLERDLKELNILVNKHKTLATASEARNDELRGALGDKAQKLGLAQAELMATAEKEKRLSSRLEELANRDLIHQRVLGVVCQLNRCSVDELEVRAQANAEALRKLSEQEASLVKETSEAKADLLTTVETLQMEKVSLQAKFDSVSVEVDRVTAVAAETDKKLHDTNAELEALRSLHEKGVTEAMGELAVAKKQHNLETAKLKKAVDTQRQRVGALEMEKRELLEEADTLNKETERLELKRKELDLSLRTALAEKEPLQAENENLNKLLAQKESALEEARKEAELSRNSVLEVSTGLRETITQLEGQLESAQNDSKGSVGRLQKEVDQLEGELEALHRQKDKADSLLETKSTKLEEAAEIITGLQQQLYSTQDNLASENEKLVRDMGTLRERQASLAHEKEQLSAASQSQSQQLAKLNRDVNGFREAKRDLSDKLRTSESARVTLQAELNSAKADLARDNSRVKLLEAQVAQLREDALDTEQTMGKLRRHAGSAANISQKELDALRERQSAQEQLVQQHELELEAKRKELGGIRSAANATIEQLNQQVRTLQESLSAEEARHSGENEALRGQLVAVEQEMERRDQAAKKTVSKLRKDADDQRRLAAQLRSDVVKAQSAADSHAKSNVSSAAEMEARLEEKHRQLNAANEAREAVLLELERIRQQTEEATDKTGHAEEVLRREITSLKEKNSSLQREISQYKHTSSGHDGEVKSLREQLEHMTSELHKSVSQQGVESEQISRRAEELESQLLATQEAANATIGELRAKISRMQAEHEAAVSDSKRKLEVADQARNAALQRRQLSTVDGSDDDGWQKALQTARSTTFSTTSNVQARTIGQYGTGHETPYQDDEKDEYEEDSLDESSRMNIVTLDENGELVLDPEDPGFVGKSSPAQALIQASAERIDILAARRAERRMQRMQQATMQKQRQAEVIDGKPPCHPASSPSSSVSASESQRDDRPGSVGSAVDSYDSIGADIPTKSKPRPDSSTSSKSAPPLSKVKAKSKRRQQQHKNRTKSGRKPSPYVDNDGPKKRPTRSQSEQKLPRIDLSSAHTNTTSNQTHGSRDG